VKVRRTAVSVRVDNDVLAWLKAQSEDAPARINEILRDRMELSAKKSVASLSRKTFSGGTNGGSGGVRPGAGRPRSPKKPRCPCGEMTMARAIARGHRCEAAA
jgi:hypothetical protein